jgi:hypothetical protein
MQIDGEPEAAAAVGASTPQLAAAPLQGAAPQSTAADQQQGQQAQEQQPEPQAAQQGAQPAGGAPADAACPGTLQASGSGTATAPAAAPAAALPPAAPAPAALPNGLTPEQAALQQQALYIGQVMMSLASVFPGMAAAISAMCGMAAAAGFTGPQLPPGMQPAFELPPVGPPPFVQTTFGEVLAARVAGTAPRGSPFCNAAQADGGSLLRLLSGGRNEAHEGC